MNKKQFLFPLILCLGLLASSCGLSSTTEDDSIYSSGSFETTSLPIEGTPIANEEQLLAIANNLDDSYYLTNDIELTADFSPLGDYANPFTSIFNGQGFKISGLSIDISQGEYLKTINKDGTTRYDITFGLFGATKNATIANLKIDDVVIQNSLLSPTIEGTVDKVRCYLGSLVGYNDKTTIANVLIENVVFDFENETIAEVRAGGLTGWQSGNVTAISIHGFDATILSNVETRIGGLTGNIDNGVISRVFIKDLQTDIIVNNDKVRVGGIAGTSEKTSLISLSAVKNTVLNAKSLAKQSHVGGIVGVMESGSVENTLVEATLYSLTTGDKPAYAGGITGALEDEVGNPKISKSVSLGKVTAEAKGSSINSFAGGIAGRFEGITGPENEFKVQIMNCYSEAEIKALATKNANGGQIIGSFTFADSKDIDAYLATYFIDLYYGEQMITATKTNNIGVKLPDFSLSTVGLNDEYWSYNNSTISLNI